MRIAIFGGTFDPFTQAHKAIVDMLLARNVADLVLIVPTVVNYHRPGYEPWLTDEERVKVINGFFDVFYKGRVAVCTDDIDAKRSLETERLRDEFAANRRYIDTLSAIVKNYGNGNTYLTVIGSDSLERFKTWHRWRDILAMSSLVVVQGRDGKDVKSDIAFTEIRIPPELSCGSATAVREKYRGRPYMDYIVAPAYGYGFNAIDALASITVSWRSWASQFGGGVRWIVGISGGKDSTVCAGLAANIFGKDSVLGVMLPNGDQKDISDSMDVISTLGIDSMTINIKDSYDSLMRQVWCQRSCAASACASVNLPPRLRMAALYLVAQSVGGIVVNTSNLSEDIMGYATLWGDTCGSYAPIQRLTVTEVIALGEVLGLPGRLIYKPPADGLQPETDEERLGVRYADVDRLIRICSATTSVRREVGERFARNRFKLDMINLPGPRFRHLPNTFRGMYASS